MCSSSGLAVLWDSTSKLGFLSRHSALLSSSSNVYVVRKVGSSLSPGRTCNSDIRPAQPLSDCSFCAAPTSEKSADKHEERLLVTRGATTSPCSDELSQPTSMSSDRHDERILETLGRALSSGSDAQCEPTSISADRHEDRLLVTRGGGLSSTALSAERHDERILDTRGGALPSSSVLSADRHEERMRDMRGGAVSRSDDAVCKPTNSGMLRRSEHSPLSIVSCESRRMVDRGCTRVDEVGLSKDTSILLSVAADARALAIASPNVSKPGCWQGNGDFQEEAAFALSKAWT